MTIQRKGERGFTLIELLVVVAIIGILAAIAIPQYAAYKRQAADADAKTNLHNAATAMEAYYGSNGNSYAGAGVPTLITTYGYRQSNAVTIAVVGPTASGYVLTASATGGNPVTFTFNADTGKIAP
jgi:prepilin-type N-terminal cleavage/methylation domain-containing protein